MNNKKELLDILRDLNSHLNYQKSMGLERVLTDSESSAIEENNQESKSEYEMVKKEGKVIKIADQQDIFDSGKKQTLEEIREKLGECTRCKLHTDRTNIVFGDGNPNARLVFVGEGPGRDEDMQGKPFVGRAGKLLTKIIEAMGNGEISPADTSSMLSALASQVRIVELDEILKRLEKLEGARN